MVEHALPINWVDHGGKKREIMGIFVGGVAGDLVITRGAIDMLARNIPIPETIARGLDDQLQAFLAGLELQGQQFGIGNILHGAMQVIDVAL